MQDKHLKFCGLLVLVGIGLLLTFAQAGATVPKPRTTQTQQTTGSHRWKYIVIHHSATRQGNGKLFDRYHKKRGMKNGLAYHFVINNGTSSRSDGELEIGNRWKKQLDGGHCRQNWINRQGIGICLVGNLSKQRITRKQSQTLLKLCKLLMERYHIPSTNVLGHGEVRGEHSQCPGKRFSLKNFRKSLVQYQRLKKDFVP